MNDGRKKKPQKHQNKMGFKIKYDKLAIEHNKKVTMKGLCKRCVEQIQWKLQYNKYKKMTEPSKCLLCSQKNVFRSYMKVCEQCTNQFKVCPKCIAKSDEQCTHISESQQKKIDREEERRMNNYFKTLREKSRRKIKRGMDKNIIFWDDPSGHFIYKNGQPIQGLYFRAGFRPTTEDSKEGSEVSDSDFGSSYQDEKLDCQGELDKSRSQKSNEKERQNYPKITPRISTPKQAKDQQNDSQDKQHAGNEDNEDEQIEGENIQDEDTQNDQDIFDQR